MDQIPIHLDPYIGSEEDICGLFSEPTDEIRVVSTLFGPRTERKFIRWAIVDYQMFNKRAMDLHQHKMAERWVRVDALTHLPDDAQMPRWVWALIGIAMALVIAAHA